MVDDEDDWFGKHVKRKKASSLEWRAQYNQQFASANDVRIQAGTGSQGPLEGREASNTRRILQNPQQQYRVVKETIGEVAMASPLPQAQLAQENAVMVDGDADAEGEADDELL